MKPHPRVRKTIKWGGAAATLLLTVVWLVSGWVAVSCDFSGGSMNVGGGIFGVSASSDGYSRSSRSWHVGVRRIEPGVPRWKWTGLWFNRPAVKVAQVPLWALSLAALVTTLAAWSLEVLARRRTRLNSCPKCGYDRAGLATQSKCPECGTSSD